MNKKTNTNELKVCPKCNSKKIQTEVLGDKSVTFCSDCGYDFSGNGAVSIIKSKGKM